VHDEAEAVRAAASGATVVGVNNRDLKTLAVSLDTSVRLAVCLPAATVRVSESGIGSRDDVARLAAAGYDALLVGERFMASGDPGAALAKLIG
jgi:indole-3-glycerol phosphate synthase